jgi:hypothetical protein
MDFRQTGKRILHKHLLRKSDAKHPARDHATPAQHSSGLQLALDSFLIVYHNLRNIEDT